MKNERDRTKKRGHVNSNVAAKHATIYLSVLNADRARDFQGIPSKTTNACTTKTVLIRDIHYYTVNDRKRRNNMILNVGIRITEDNVMWTTYIKKAKDVHNTTKLNVLGNFHS